MLQRIYIYYIVHACDHTDCAVCEPGYSKSLGYSCSKCVGEHRSAATTAIAIVIVILILLLLWLLYELLGLGDGVDATNTVTGCNPAILQSVAKLPWDKLRTPLIVFQILTQYIGVTGLRVPLLYRDFLRWLEAISIDFSWLLSVGCVVQVSFYQRLLLNTIAPFGCAAILCCTYSIVYYRNTATTVSFNRQINADRRERLEKSLAKHVLMFLAMTFLIYSTVSTVIFQTFACDKIPNGGSYLRADYSVSCRTRKHTVYKVYSGVMILVYPIGIPALYAYLLWQQRKQLHTSSDASTQARDNDVSLRKTRFLWQTYKPAVYYWEVVECVRRLLLTGTMVFIFPNSTAQPAIACLLAASAVVLVLWWNPHADSMDARIYVLGSIIVFLSVFLSLLVKVQDDAAAAVAVFRGAHTYSATLIVLNILMVVAAIAQLVLVGGRARLTKRPTLRGLLSKRKSSRSNMATVAESDIVVEDSSSITDVAPYDTIPVRRQSTVALMEAQDATSISLDHGDDSTVTTM
jgi:hypothetical protein